MRNRFDNQLAEMNNELISMGALCENAIASAVKALLEGESSWRLPPSASIRRSTARNAKSSPCASSCCCSSSRLRAICV